MKKKGFVCQSCSNMVPPNTDRCPHCGKFFKGVRCPECHYVGVASDFVHGCPSCGFLSDDEKNGSYGLKEEGKHKHEFPAWFYILSAAVLASMVAVFIFLIYKS